MYPMNAVMRYTVPIDGEWHDLSFVGDIVHVAGRREDEVDLWTLAPSGNAVAPEVTRRFRVFGTGHRIPVTHYRHHGTALTEGGALVWHLIENLGAFTLKGLPNGTE